MMRKFFTLATILAICVFHLIPFYLLINLSLKTIRDMSSRLVPPNYLYLDNFVNAWNEANLGRAFLNTVLITTVSVALIITLGALAAYPLARYTTRWNNFVYILCVSIMIVPPLTILVPLYKLIVDMGAMSTYWGIILIHTTFWLPISIFMYTGFIRTIPRELDEAALIDGCSQHAVFFRIILPLLKPVTATVMIVTGLVIWNDFAFSLFFLQKAAVQTVPLVLSHFFGQYAS